MNEKRTKISFIVPFSIHSQGVNAMESWINDPLLRDHEVLIICDTGNKSVGELNETHSLCTPSVDSPSHIKWHSVSGGCPGIPRNLGTKLATGDWIYFWDSDDIPHTSRAIHLVNHAESVGADIAIGLARIDGPSISRTIGNSWLEIVRWPGLWRFAVRKDLIKDLRFKEWQWCEDQEFLVQTLNRASLVYRGSEIIYNYRHGNQGSLTSTPKNWRYLINFRDELLRVQDTEAKSIIALLFYIKTLFSLSRQTGLRKIMYSLITLPKVILLHRDFRFPKVQSHQESNVLHDA